MLSPLACEENTSLVQVARSKFITWMTDRSRILHSERRAPEKNPSDTIY